MKYIHSFIFVFIFILYPFFVKAQYVVSIDDIDYNEQTCTISNYKWPEEGKENIIVPSHFGSLEVKNIGAGCFMNVSPITDNNSGLKSVTIEKGIEQIGHSAFLYNKISKLNLNEDLKIIGDFCFNSSLVSIGNLVLPNTISIIGPCAFVDCGITSITLPEHIEIIGERSFEGNLLTHIIIPSGVKKIGDDAFHNNNINDLEIMGEVGYLSGFRENNLQNVNIPGTVEVVGERAFCDNPLSSVSIGHGVHEIGAMSFASFVKIGELEPISQLEHIDIPSSVEIIRSEAFACNHKLNTINFSEGLIEICSGAFRNCTLTEISFPSSLQKIGERAFSVNQLYEIHFKDGLNEIGEQAFYFNNITNLILPNTLMKIGAGAFEYSGVDEISLPTMNGTKYWDMFNGSTCTTRNITFINQSNMVMPYSYQAHIEGTVTANKIVVFNMNCSDVQCVDLFGRTVNKNRINSAFVKTKKMNCLLLLH